MKKMRLLVFPAVLTTGLCLTVDTAIWIDPLFHDHPPLKDSFYAPDHERSINDGTTGYCRYKNKLSGYHDHFVRSCDPR